MKACKLVLIVAGALAGCSSLPTVEYKKLDGWDPEGRMRYALPKSIIVIDYPKDKDGKRITSGASGVELTVVPAESETSFAVAADDPWGRKTTLQWTKIANTELLATVGTEVIDNRVKIINSIGETAANGISLGASLGLLSYKFSNIVKIPLTEEPLPDTEPYPVAFDLENKNLDEDLVFPSGKSPLILKATIPSEAPLGSVLLKSISTPLGLSQMRHVLLTSACQKVTIEIKSGKFKGKVLEAKFADPRYVQTIPLPQKGTVSLHSSCGANVVASTTADSLDVEVVAAAVAQAKSLAETWKKNASRQPIK